MEALPTLALDTRAADRAAGIRRELKASGQAIGMADSRIAGIVLANSAILLTRNRRHFVRVAGLRLGSLPD